MKDDKILEEVNRCLNCKIARCAQACPFNNNIPNIIQNLKENDIEKAYSILKQTSIIPEICSQVCKRYCEKNCVLGIKGESIHIRNIEKYICDNSKKEDEEHIEKRGKYNIAIVGSGPSGISCAYYLAKRGYNITIYEKKQNIGGIISNELPSYRINQNIIDNVINKLIHMGVNIKYNIELGKNIKIEELSSKYDAVFLAIGCENPNMLNVEGEKLNNIYTSKYFLENVKREEITDYDIKNKKVCIVGGGNVALDCANTCSNLNAKDVTIIYRRTKNEMPINDDEYELACKNDVKFEYLSLPTKFIGKDSVNSIRCIKMKLGDIDESGRRSPIVIENSDYNIDTDIVIVALGCKVEENDITGIEINKGGIVINDNFLTNINNVFAGGDCTNKEKSVTYASHMGIEGAKNIIKYLNVN